MKAIRLKKTDWLQELRATLILGLILMGLLAAAGIADAVAGPLHIKLPAGEVTGSVESGLRSGSVLPEQDLTVAVAGPSTWQRALWMLSTLPTHLVVLTLLVLLLRIVHAARRTDPFTMATVRRLRVLAVVTFAGGYLAVIVQMLASMELSSTVLSDAISGYSEVPTYWFLVGFGLLAVAEVVKRGCALRAELETVI